MAISPDDQIALLPFICCFRFARAYQSLVSIDFWEVFGHEVFSPERSLNQPKATRVCVRSINQSNRFISVRLLFPFCSRVFISRSYENRSNQQHCRKLRIPKLKENFNRVSSLQETRCFAKCLRHYSSLSKGRRWRPFRRNCLQVR